MKIQMFLLASVLGVVFSGCLPPPGYPGPGEPVPAPATVNPAPVPPPAPFIPPIIIPLAPVPHP